MESEVLCKSKEPPVLNPVLKIRPNCTQPASRKQNKPTVYARFPAGFVQRVGPVGLPRAPFCCCNKRSREDGRPIQATQYVRSRNRVPRPEAIAARFQGLVISSLKQKTSANQLPKRDPEINNLPNAHNTYVHSTHPLHPLPNPNK